MYTLHFQQRLEPSGPEAGLWTGFGQLAAALVEPLLAGVGPLGRRGRRLVLALQQVPDRVDLGAKDRSFRPYRVGDFAVEELRITAHPLGNRRAHVRLEKSHGVQIGDGDDDEEGAAVEVGDRAD